MRDVREEKPIEKTFHYEGGIKEFVNYLNKGKQELYDDVIYCEGTVNNVYVEVAMQHNDAYTENTLSFVNNINTPEVVHRLKVSREQLQKHLITMQNRTKF